MNTNNIKDIGIEKPETINYLNYNPPSYSPEDINQHSFTPLFRDWFMNFLDHTRNFLLGIYIFMLEMLCSFFIFCEEVVGFALTRARFQKKR